MAHRKCRAVQQAVNHGRTDRRHRNERGDPLHRRPHLGSPAPAGRAAIQVLPSLGATVRPGNARHIGEDQAALALAIGTFTNELVPLDDSAAGALELAPVDALGDTQIALNLLRRATEEEPQLDDDLLALGQLRDDLADASVVEPRRQLLVQMSARVQRLDAEDLVVERDRAPAPGSLALVHGLVERGLGEVGPDLGRAHRVDVELTISLLLKEHRVRIVEQGLAIGWIKPSAAPSEHAEHVITVLLIGRRRSRNQHCALMQLTVVMMAPLRPLAGPSPASTTRWGHRSRADQSKGRQICA